MVSSNTTNWILAVAAGALLVLIPAAASAQQAPNAGGTISAARKKADSVEKQGADKKAPARPARRTSSRRSGRSQLRDPFQSLGGGGGRTAPGGSRKLPPGVRGLLISQIQVGGIVLGGRGKIAVVGIQGRDRAFFLREGDRVYDGILKEIRSDRVIFRQRSRDAFGRVLVRDVTKMLTSLPIGP